MELTLEELQVFLGLWIFMGICTLPSYNDYWTEPTRVPFEAEAMPLSRFKFIRSRLHLIDNQTIPEDNRDPLIKVRPLINHIKQKCNSLPQNSTTFSIDESMSPYKGMKAGPLRQYIKGKPHKWGFKAFMLTSSSGIVFDFIVYSGSRTFEVENVVEREGLGAGGNVVFHLCKTIQRPRISSVCFDNYFSSIPLICQLKEDLGLVSIGTIRLNRTKECPLPSDKALIKQGRGTSVVQSTFNGQVAVVKWVDNRVVNLAGSWCGINPQEVARRWDKSSKSKVSVPCPNIVSLYNQNMGGVDVFDMLMHLYKLPSRAKRWTTPMISFMIDLSLVNAYLLFRSDSRSKEEEENDEFSSKNFRLQVVQALLSTKIKRRVGRPTLEESLNSSTEKVVHRARNMQQPPDATRLDGINHMIVFEKKKGRCFMCKAFGLDGYTFAKCSKCNVKLCVLQHRNCFHDFHTADV
ncbi:PiggyBac transposable element-derived protein 3 [Frankliniella fusca]|uniref:PiggyBac transposable element-derived protein 3 n=1 Tax=Frankliniella fusca TaxID=407009 RepID=A0AAE1LX01_9NEOP|nr:PiggyBac transposable element-derived protein 3 [Frankliniella fusca]